MAEYINRNDALKQVLLVETRESMFQCIKDIPAADVVARKALPEDSEDLVKALRNCGYPGDVHYCRDCVFANDGGTCHREKLLPAAADAIESLMNISNSILSKYKIAAETVIWEYSVKINEDSDKLLKEIECYKAQINGDAKPPKEE